MRSFTFFFLCSTLGSADAPAPTKLPTIPATHLVDYYRSDAAVVRTQQTLRDLQDEREVAMEAIRKDCGDKFMPFVVGKDIVCAPNPEPLKK